MELTNEALIKKANEKIAESNPQLRKELSIQIDQIYDESVRYLKLIQERYDSYFDPEQKYIILYYMNSVSIARDIALLQKQYYNQNSSVMIASRSVFEGCSTSLKLIEEYRKNECSEFFKYLIVNDLYQDLTIYNGWNELNLDYLNRFHRKISNYFPDSLKDTNLSEYIEWVTNYSSGQIENIVSIIHDLHEKYRHKYKYTKSKLCKNFFATNTLINDELKAYIPVMYPMNCHFSHLNVSGIEDMCFVTIDDINRFSLNNNHYQLLPTIQFVVYSLQYLFDEIKKFIERSA